VRLDANAVLAVIMCPSVCPSCVCVSHTTNCPWKGRGHVIWSSLNYKALNIPQE